MTFSSSKALSSDAIFIPIDLEASLGRIDMSNSNNHHQYNDNDRMNDDDYGVEANGKNNNKHGGRSIRTIQQTSSLLSASSSVEDKDGQQKKKLIDETHTRRYSEPQPYRHRVGRRSKFPTRTSLTTPFVHDEESDNGAPSNIINNNFLTMKPYPISETADEIRERRRLSESANVLISSQQYDNDNEQQSMMEVTVMGGTELEEFDNCCSAQDDFVLSAEEASCINELDNNARTIIQDDPVKFWEAPMDTINIGGGGGNTSVATASVTLSSSIGSSNTNNINFNHNDDDSLLEVPPPYGASNDDDVVVNDDEKPDASPIRSTDMEW